MFILIQAVLGLTLTHKYLCCATWEPLFPSVRDEIISTWRHVKVMLISSQQQNMREGISKHIRLYHESLPKHFVSSLGFFSIITCRSERDAYPQ